MKLYDLKPAEGSTSNSFRRGRGHGSGNGKTAGKGHKGQNARSGGGVRPGFEGGQMPLYRRIPKRGFQCINSKDIVAINVGLLNSVFESGDVITVEALQSKGLVSHPGDGIKILGNGEVTKKFTVQLPEIKGNKTPNEKKNAHRKQVFSKSAIEKIEAAGGKAEVI